MGRVLIVNPNANRTVTRWLADEARRVAPSGVEIVGVNANSGLEALQTPQDIETAGRAVVDAIASETPLRGAIVAAFGDPGLAAARAVFSASVVGLGECGMKAAGAGGARFSLVTLGAAMRAAISAKAAALGLEACLDEIEVLPFSIAEMVADREAKRGQIVEAVGRSRCEIVLLGGAPFAGLAHQVGRETRKTVLDGVAASLAAIMARAEPC